jgi:hypothetical protein
MAKRHGDTKFHFSANQPAMPAQQSIGGNERVQFDQGLTSQCLGFPREQRSLCIGEPDSPPAQPVFKQSVFGLEKLDDDQLVAMNPTSRDHQQKRQQRGHGTHAPVYRTPRLNCWTLRGMLRAVIGHGEKADFVVGASNPRPQGS